jgi:hypothetical protein
VTRASEPGEPVDPASFADAEPASDHVGTPDYEAPAPPPSAGDPAGSARRSWPDWRQLRPHATAAELRFSALLIVALALLGLLIGFWWAEVAPRVTLTVFEVGKAAQNNEVAESLIAADGWFALIGAGLGLATGALAWTVRPARGVLLLLALVVGSFGGAVVAWRFGVWLGRHPTPKEAGVIFSHVGATLRQPLGLRAKAALFFQPFGAVLAAVLAAGFTRAADLRSRAIAADERGGDEPSRP